MSEIISNQWKDVEALLARDPAAAATFLPGGHSPAAGDVFRNPHLAATLEQIARGGRDAFYKGPIAKAIAADMQRRNALLTEADLAANKPDWVEPISTNYRGYDVLELPPNTQGVVTLEMLNILEGFDIKSMRHNSAEYLHLLVEAKRMAFADRDAWLADANSVPARRAAADAVEGLCRGPPARVQSGARGRGIQAVVTAGFFAGARGTSAGARRHHLHDRRGSRGQCRLADSVAVRGLRLRHRRGRHRHRAAQPRRALHAPGRPSESDRPGQAAVPHAGARDGA